MANLFFTYFHELASNLFDSYQKKKNMRGIVNNLLDIKLVFMKLHSELKH